MTDALWPISVCAASVALLLVCEYRDFRPGVWLFKTAASLCFIWAALSSGALSSAYGRRVLVALGLCLLGDLLLLSRKRKTFFLAGLGLFLLGHVAYVGAFVTQPLGASTLAIAGAALAAFGYFVLSWLKPSLPANMRWPVRAYVAVICSMSAFACAVAAGGGPIAIALGALAFTASDLAVARERFVRHAFLNRAWGLPVYYAAQLTLALSPRLVTQG